MKKYFHQKGFTLIELLIAIGIFSILIAIGVGGFVHALHTQREVAALIATQSNASIALEQMAREIRTGYLFCNDIANNGQPSGACFSSCAVNGSVWTCNGFIDFYNAATQHITYSVGTGGLQRSESGGAGIPITSNGVKVTHLAFTLFGNTEGDHWAPRITISLGVTPNSTDPVLANDVLNLQTTVSARGIDCLGSSC